MATRRRSLERRSEPAELPRNLPQPRGWWRWQYASECWEYCIEDEAILVFSDRMLAEMRGRVPQKEPFIEFLEGTFMNSLVIRRIYTEDHSAIVAFLRERGIILTADDL